MKEGGEHCVAHLPISPRSEAPIGYYETAICTDALAQNENCLPLFNINIIGEKGKNIKDINSYIQNLNKIGITKFHLMVDESYVQDIEKIINATWGKLIEEKDVKVIKNDSGKIEFLAVGENVEEKINKYRKSLYRTNQGKAIEKATEIELKEYLIKGLVLKLPENGLPKIDIFPNYAKMEISQLWDKFKNKELLISRSSQRKLLICSPSGNRKYYIDSDFCWMPHLYIAEEKNKLHVNTLVIVHENIKQAILSLMVCQQLGGELPQKIIVLPKIFIKSPEGKNVSLDQILETHSPEVARFILLWGLGCSRKELIIPSSMPEQLSKFISNRRYFLGDSSKFNLAEISPRDYDWGNEIKMLRKNLSGRISKWKFSYAMRNNTP